MLSQLNEYLLGNIKDPFRVNTIEKIPKIKYIITLDADTDLILNSAFELIGAMAHILNKPVINPNTNTVVEGYGIIQPRVGIDLDISYKTTFTRIFALTDSVPNSESYYTSTERLVNQESREQVLKLYKKFGFDTDFHNSNEPEDFIAYELMFMSYLSKMAAKRMQNGKEDDYNLIIKAQNEFIKNHLLNYIDEFINKMEMFEQGKIFYLPLTYFLREYLKYDLEFLNSLNN